MVISFRNGLRVAMGGIERKLSIMKKIQEEGKANIAELAEEYGVSVMTIRRDLAKFAKEGLITLEYGGAVLNTGALFEYNMVMKQGECQEEKRRIARECVSYINDGDSIFLDAGTTICEIARLIAGWKNLTVMTHSLMVANVLSKNDSIDLVMCPGKFRATSMAYMGQLTDDFVSSFRFDKLFLAVEGVHPEAGVSVPNLTDGITKKNLVKQAKNVICAADSSKFGKSFYYCICGLEEIDMIITDTGLDLLQVRQYEGRTVLKTV